MILIVLAEQDAHGYELARQIRERSEGKIRLETGPLYRHLKRLLADGLIVETHARPTTERDDERRRYYRVSRLGRSVLAAETQRLVRLIDRVQQLEGQS
jgi:DNA-binding PadR family transcriptional regulator